MIEKLTGPLALGALLALATPTAGFAEEGAVDYSDKDAWLCRPDNLRACDTDLTATVVTADGEMFEEGWERNEDADVDCFYVYPTVSRDSTPNSDMEAGPEEMNVIRQQFARFGSQCRTFAPLYRQVTLTALRANMSGDGDSARPDRELGYNDVVDAWNHYLENHNDGRGVVLIGHSQGSGVLSRMIAAEIEGKPVQDQIVSALLLGTTVQVAKGEVVGGTFKEMPICQSAEELSCVVTYAAYRSTVPPPANALFGRNRSETESACTNPAQLVKGSSELHAYLGNTTMEGSSSAPPARWTDDGREVDTPFVSVPGLLSGECVKKNGGSYLEVTVQADPDDPRTDDIAGDVMADGEVNASWGLHLVDVNLAMGDLITLVGKQAKNYLAKQ